MVNLATTLLLALVTLSALTTQTLAFGVSTDPTANTFSVRKAYNASAFMFNLANVNVTYAPTVNGGGNTGATLGFGNSPAIAGLGISQARVKLWPCGWNLPHLHPRGTELLYVISGNHADAIFMGWANQ